MAARMMQHGARFLEIGAPVVGTNAAVVEHNEGIPICFASGEILQIMTEGKIIYRSRPIATSCGAPLVNMGGIAIGIHKGIYADDVKTAVKLDFALQLYFQQRNNLLETARQGIFNDVSSSV